MTRAIVCGGRDFRDSLMFDKVMDTLHEKYKFTMIIEGGAAGADDFAKVWAQDRDIMVVEVPANWKKGKSAGSERNRNMIKKLPNQLVIAFPGGKGTQDMCDVAMGMGTFLIKVYQDGTVKEFK